MKKRDHLQNKIEKSLADLLDGKIDAEKKEELRRDVLLAIKWQAVKLKMEDEQWGSGFTNGTVKGGKINERFDEQ